MKIASVNQKMLSRLDFVATIGERRHSFFVEANVPLVRSYETVLLSSFIPAMKMGKPMNIDGDVSEKLFQATDLMQDILKSWFPEFRRVQVNVKSIAKENHKAKGVACFFTAGVDSFYTLLKHKDEITHIIFVHGFDIRLDEQDYFEKVLASINEIANQTQKKLIVLKTDVKDMANEYIHWADYYGWGLASVGHLLRNEISKIFIASSYCYADVRPNGSHPILDPHWSTENLEIVHDGCEATRFEKIRAIAKSDIALKNLRVCYLNTSPSGRNCGKCEKCIRTMVALDILGVLGKTNAFDEKLKYGLVRHTKTDVENKNFVDQNIKALKDSGVSNPDLLEALEDCKSGVCHKGVIGWPIRGKNYLKRMSRKIFPNRRKQGVTTLNV